MNPAEWLARTARLYPDAPALLKGTQLIADYATFSRRAASIGRALKQHYGISRGDRVALFMSNRTEYLEVLYGAWFVGAAVVPINPKLHFREARYILGNADASVLFISDDIGGQFKSTAPDCINAVISTDQKAYIDMYRAEPLAQATQMLAGDLLWLFYTSGTTGKPKGVMMSCANLQAMTLGYFVDIDDVGPTEAILYATPMSHGAGLYNFMYVLRGARHVVPDSGGFNADEIFSLASKLEEVSFFAAPTMIRRLVDHAKNKQLTGKGIKTIVYGGGPMYLVDIIEAIDILGPRFAQIYGQGECPMAITATNKTQTAERSHPQWKTRLASVGRAQSSVLVKIVDVNGSELPCGKIGEIVVAGMPVMKGYWRNSEATQQAIRSGWLWTGDMGSMDEDGFISLHDRSKDVIISGGSNIYPREVEEILLTHPGVHEISVIGRPHPDWGEEVIAFVVRSGEGKVDDASLDKLCINNIARFKRPKAYFYPETLPKNEYGKILKTSLREGLTSAGNEHEN